MVQIKGVSIPDNCFRCFASHWYNCGGKEAGFQCKALPGDSKIISNCEGRAKRRDDCPLATGDNIRGSCSESQYNLHTPEGIAEAYVMANHKANQEPNQGGYNAAWLHGYADALREVSQQLKAPTYVEIIIRREYAAIVRALEEAERLHEADKRSVKKRELYQFMVAEEFAISELCKVLEIELRDENMNLIA